MIIITRLTGIVDIVGKEPAKSFRADEPEIISRNKGWYKELFCRQEQGERKGRKIMEVEDFRIKFFKELS